MEQELDKIGLLNKGHFSPGKLKPCDLAVAVNHRVKYPKLDFLSHDKEIRDFYRYRFKLFKEKAAFEVELLKFKCGGALPPKLFIQPLLDNPIYYREVMNCYEATPENKDSYFKFVDLPAFLGENIFYQKLVRQGIPVDYPVSDDIAAFRMTDSSPTDILKNRLGRREKGLYEELKKLCLTIKNPKYSGKYKWIIKKYCNLWGKPHSEFESALHKAKINLIEFAEIHQCYQNPVW